VAESLGIRYFKNQWISILMKFNVTVDLEPGENYYDFGMKVAKK